MHAELYAGEYGFDERFEAHVAHGLADFATALGEAHAASERSSPGWLWVAERAERAVGTIALTDEGDGVAQVRWFLVDPAARGTGLGRELLRTLLDHARTEGFVHLKLWTVDLLDAAARLYGEVGFRCTERNPTRQWGRDLAELRYDLELNH